VSIGKRIGRPAFASERGMLRRPAGRTGKPGRAPPTFASERGMLRAFLDYQRATLAMR
jgi:hypothetical protein